MDQPDVENDAPVPTAASPSAVSSNGTKNVGAGDALKGVRLQSPAQGRREDLLCPMLEPGLDPPADGIMVVGVRDGHNENAVREHRPPCPALPRSARDRFGRGRRSAPFRRTSPEKINGHGFRFFGRRARSRRPSRARKPGPGPVGLRGGRMPGRAPRRETRIRSRRPFPRLQRNGDLSRIRF